MLFGLSVVAVMIVAVAFRTPHLKQRPMHGDEAVHGIKFGELLEQGKYEYDPYDYHGPTLNYLTLIPAWLSSRRELSQVDEWTLRIVPVFFGVALAVLPVLISGGIGRSGAIVAGMLTAVSPSMVYYSRYYIQEMLLVCFGFAAIVCGYRYVRGRRAAWAIGAGACIGLMYATKETFVIAVAAAAAAIAAVVLLKRKESGTEPATRGLRGRDIAWAMIAAVAVAVVLYSSFFTHPRGIVDAVRTYGTYLERAGDKQIHAHPWDYYLRIILYWRYGDGPVWSEAVVVLLAIVGAAGAFLKPERSGLDRDFVRFALVYTVLMTAVYSAISYKTPWCLLGFLQGMIVLAGIGAAILLRICCCIPTRAVVVALVAAGCVHLGRQAHAAAGEYDCDPRSPYVYAHPTEDVFLIVDGVERAAEAHRDGRDMPIQVIMPGADFWPLPWYMRSFSKVYWRSDVEPNEPSAPLILASPSVEPALLHKLYELTPFEKRQMYMFLFEPPYYMWLRPGIQMVGYARRDLWNAMNQPPAEAVETEAAP